MRHLLLHVHGQHLAAEGQALGLLNHLLVGRHGVVAHHHVTLKDTFKKKKKKTLGLFNAGFCEQHSGRVLV